MLSVCDLILTLDIAPEAAQESLDELFSHLEARESCVAYQRLRLFTHEGITCARVALAFEGVNLKDLDPYLEDLFEEHAEVDSYDPVGEYTAMAGLDAFAKYCETACDDDLDAEYRESIEDIELLHGDDEEEGA